MKTKGKLILLVLVCCFGFTTLISCEQEQITFKKENQELDVDNLDVSKLKVSPSTVAQLFANMPIEREHLGEVHNAVSSSITNGYDEEYTMSNVFMEPGSGVGNRHTKASLEASNKRYSNPVRDMMRDFLNKYCKTKAGGADDMSVERYLDMLSKSDLQIYWPYSDNWDGQTYPIITFDPEINSESNVGYKLVVGRDGERSVQKVIVTEEIAKECPVWVLNRNEDSNYKTIEVLRRDNPEWGAGGALVLSKSGESSSNDIKTLVIRDFLMKRHYDCWFAGASEFFIKCGSVENFNASTEAEMKIYEPSITDFVIVVKRREINTKKPLKVVLVSEWTKQLEKCAFLITEDDGGTRKTWKCAAVVKIKSKSYGFDVQLPFNSRDDIVWRGSLTRNYIEKYLNKPSNFGDVSITFDLI